MDFSDEADILPLSEGGGPFLTRKGVFQVIFVFLKASFL